MRRRPIAFATNRYIWASGDHEFRATLGSELLIERLKDKIGIDFDTARRLFTLITVLHWKG